MSQHPAELDWPFFDDAHRGFKSRLDAWCAEHLAHLDEVAWTFFGTDAFKEIVRSKVAALYPKHEIDLFTDHFFDQVQKWRVYDAAQRGVAG